MQSIEDGSVVEKSIVLYKKEDAYNYCLQFEGFSKFTHLQEKVLSDSNFWNPTCNLIIQGSTSSGKTLLAEIAMYIDYKRYQQKNKVLYVVPFKSLVNDKCLYFRTRMGNCSEIVPCSKDYRHNDNIVINGQCDVAVVIYEKLYKFVSCNGMNFLCKYDLILLDEFSMVENKDRGLIIDMLLLYVKMAKIRGNQSLPRIIATTSPFINLEEYAKIFNLYIISDDTRPVPLVESIYSKPFGVEYPKNLQINGIQIKSKKPVDNKSDIAINLAIEHIKRKNNVIVFCNDRDKTRRLAVDTCTLLRKNNPELYKEIPARLIKKLNYVGDNSYAILNDKFLLNLSFGIAYHNSNLPPLLRSIIEQEFTSSYGIIHLLFATETIAYGINTATDIVIIEDAIKRVDERKTYLSFIEYHNYIGRAGRLNSNKEYNIGYGHLIAEDAREIGLYKNKYYLGTSQIAESTFFKKSDNDVALSLLWFVKNEGLIGIKQCKLVEDIITLPHLEQINSSIISRIGNMLNMLKKEGLILIKSEESIDNDNIIVLTAYGQEMAGELIKLSSCSTLKETLTTNAKEDHENLLVFDLLYAICNCEEIDDVSIRFADSSRGKRFIKFTEKFCILIEELLNKHVISKTCYHQIKNDIKEIKINYDINNCSLTDHDIIKLRNMKKAMILWLWANGYLIKSINIEYNLNVVYGQIINIAEMASYFFDVAARISTTIPAIQSYSNLLESYADSIRFGLPRNILNYVRENVTYVNRELLCNISKVAKEKYNNNVFATITNEEFSCMSNVEYDLLKSCYKGDNE